MARLLQVDVQDGVATVLLNNPPINGLVPALLDEVMATLGTLGRDPKVRAIILGSAIAGRFCGFGFVVIQLRYWVIAST